MSNLELIKNPHKWPSTENLGNILRDILSGKIKHKYCDLPYINDFLNHQVVITEKIDGSNVSVGNY